MDSHLGTETGLTGNRTKLNGMVGNFADLDLEETADEIGVATGENDLGAAGAVLHGYNVGADTVTDIVLLGRYTLTGRHDPLELAEVEDHIAAVKTTDGSADDFAGAVLKLLVDHLLLDLTDTLGDGLTGGLRGDTAKVTGSHLDLDLLTGLDLVVDEAGLGHGNLLLGIGDSLDHKRLRESADGAAFGVDVDADLAGAGKALLGSGNEGRGDGLDEGLSLDTFFTLEVIEHGDKFGVHGNGNSRRTGQEGFRDSVSGVGNYGGLHQSGQLKQEHPGPEFSLTCRTDDSILRPHGPRFR